jgi:hypothetical protein
MSVEDQLIARLGKQIDLPAYLAHRGYDFAGTLRGHDSTAGHTVGIVMRAGTVLPGVMPSLLVLARDPERGGWSYTDTTNPANRGNIGDYLQHHEKLSQTSALERIAACLDRHRRDVPEAEHYRECLANKPLPLRRAENEHQAISEQHRDVLADLARLGVRTNTVIDTAGARTTVPGPPSRFQPLQVRADLLRLVEEPAKIWTSAYRPTDKQLVLVERGIDAVAHAQKHRNPDVCYVAVGSELTPVRRAQLAHLLAELPSGMSVVAAFGRDERGRHLTEDVGRLVPHIPLKRSPPDFGARWSDQMQLEARHERSMNRAPVAGLAR